MADHTGTGSGLGREIEKVALDAHGIVVAGARDPASFASLRDEHGGRLIQ